MFKTYGIYDNFSVNNYGMEFVQRDKIPVRAAGQLLLVLNYPKYGYLLPPPRNPTRNENARCHKSYLAATHVNNQQTECAHCASRSCYNLPFSSAGKVLRKSQQDHRSMGTFVLLSLHSFNLSFFNNLFTLQRRQVQ